MRYVVEPVATPADLDEIDQAVRITRPTSPEMQVWFDRYVANHSVRLAHDLAIVREHVPRDARILEVGSLPPVMLAALSRRYDIVGIDLEPERFADVVSNGGLKIRKCDIEHASLPFENDTFSCVLLNEVFEHLRINPIFTMREILRVLRPGGLLLLSTPNLFSWVGIKRFLFERRATWCGGGIFEEYEKLASLKHMGHVREYTPGEVAEFLEAVGFSVTCVLCRGESPRGLERLVVRVAPRLRRFMSVVATKNLVTLA